MIHTEYDPADNNYLTAEFNRYVYVEGAAYGEVRISSEQEAESMLNPGDRCTIWRRWPAPGVSRSPVKTISKALD